MAPLVSLSTGFDCIMLRGTKLDVACLAATQNFTFTWNTGSDSAIGSPNTYPLDSAFQRFNNQGQAPVRCSNAGWCYPPDKLLFSG